MAESLIAMSILTIAGTALLTSISTAVKNSSDATNVAAARGLALQLMDEISATRFPAATNPAATNATIRATYTVIDHFSGWSASPPTDRNGYAIGTEGTSAAGIPATRSTLMQPNTAYLANWSQQVIVEKVTPGGTGGWTVSATHTNYRRVTVNINSKDPTTQTVTTLAQLVRIFAYVPTST